MSERVEGAGAAGVEAAIQTLVRIERENRVNCTGLGEVGCDGRNEWHSWPDHRLHVAAAQVAALIDAGLLAQPTAAPSAAGGADGGA